MVSTWFAHHEIERCDIAYQFVKNHDRNEEVVSGIVSDCHRSRSIVGTIDRIALSVELEVRFLEFRCHIDLVLDSILSHHRSGQSDIIVFVQLYHHLAFLHIIEVVHLHFSVPFANIAIASVELVLTFTKLTKLTIVNESARNILFGSSIDSEDYSSLLIIGVANKVINAIVVEIEDELSILDIEVNCLGRSRSHIAEANLIEDALESHKVGFHHCLVVHLVEFTIDDLSDIQDGTIFQLKIGVVVDDILLVELFAQCHARYVDRSTIEVVLVVELNIVVQVRIELSFCRVLERYKYGIRLLWYVPFEVKIVDLVVVAKHCTFNCPIAHVINDLHLCLQTGDSIKIRIV